MAGEVLKKRQFTLRGLLLVVFVVATAMGILRGLEPEWRIVVVVAGVIFVLCLAISFRT
jgi:hypothetical protein